MYLNNLFSRLRRFKACIYQGLFLKPFRIKPSINVMWHMTNNHALIASLAQFIKAKEQCCHLEHYKKNCITDEFAKNICNEHFRLTHHLAQLEKIPNPPRSVQRIRSTAEYLKQAFIEQGIEYYDLTGQDYHAGRLDFENIAAAEVDASLNKPKIIVCENPAIFLHGKLIQIARGIVARPP